jgi:hypothetical protein
VNVHLPCSGEEWRGEPIIFAPRSLPGVKIHANAQVKKTDLRGQFFHREITTKGMTSEPYLLFFFFLDDEALIAVILQH